MNTPRRIIVADDDSNVRQLLEQALRPPEFEVHTFPSGTEVLEALPDLRPDCVVSDMLKKYLDLMDYLIPMYEREGKAYLTIAIGCTGGQHRSVYLVEKLARQLDLQGAEIIKRHRELE